MTDSQSATQAAVAALAWLWIVGGGVLTAGLAAAVTFWTVQEVRERRRRRERESQQRQAGDESPGPLPDGRDLPPPSSEPGT